jgi:uncharacterized protein (DUF736 family)
MDRPAFRLYSRRRGWAKRSILYTRFFSITLDCKLFETVVSSNLTSDARRKAALDRIVDSVWLK